MVVGLYVGVVQALDVVEFHFDHVVGWILLEHGFEVDDFAHVLCSHFSEFFGVLQEVPVLLDGFEGVVVVWVLKFVDFLICGLAEEDEF